MKKHAEHKTSRKSDIKEQIKSNYTNCLIHQNATQNTFNESHTSNSSTNEVNDIFHIIQNAIVCFISKMYSNSSVPRNITQIIIENIRELFISVNTSIEYELKKQNVVEDIFNTICAIFREVDNIFEKLGTEYKRLKFLKNNEYYIEPHAFFIGERSVLAKTNKSYEINMIIEKSEGQIIELRQILKQFLELPHVFDEIMFYMQEESLYDNNVRNSILQGNLWRKVKLKFPNKIVFPLYLFYDDFEPNNPLGSKSGIYKVGAVYISIASIPIQFASFLENIFLTQLNFSVDRVEYGNKKIFSKIILQLK